MLNKTIETNVETAVPVVKAYCLLYNFVMTCDNTSRNLLFQAVSTYSNPVLCHEAYQHVQHLSKFNEMAK